MPKIVNTGPDRVLAPSAGGHRFPTGVSVEVDEETAARLLRQPGFVEAPRSKGRGSAAASNPNVETRGGASRGQGPATGQDTEQREEEGT